MRLPSLLAAVGLLGVGASVAGAAGARTESAGQSERVHRSTRAIDQLAADGVRVAMLYSGGGPGPCIAIWNVSTGKVDGFPGTAERCPGVTEDDRSIEITEVALGGERVLWAEVESNATTYWSVLTATLDRRAPVDVYSFSSGDSSNVRGLRGDGELLVFAAFDPQERPQSRLYRAHPRKASLVRTFPRGVQVIGVDAPAIVVGARKGSLEVLSAGGKLLRTLDVRVAEVRSVAVDGSSLVVQRGRSLDVYDIDTGRLVNTWRMSGGLLEDSHRGIAVYVTGTAVRLIRLSDGRDIVLSTPTRGSGEGPLQAQIEAPGLVYSYVNYKAAPPGRVVFVPYRQLVRRFG